MQRNEFSISDELKEEIDFILRSELRIKILSHLFNENLSLNQLSKMGFNYNSLYSNIKQLESRKLIFKKDGLYCLKNVARKKIGYVLNLNKLSNTLNDLEDYLNSHLICYSDLDVLSTIPNNVTYEIFNKENSDPYNVIHKFSNNLIRGNENKCILTHIHQEYFCLNKSYDSSCELEILAEDKLIQHILENHDNFSDDKRYNIKVKAINPIKLSLVVNSEEMMLQLYDSNGGYDPGSAIISEDNKLIDWAYKLFNEISSKSDNEWKEL